MTVSHFNSCIYFLIFVEKVSDMGIAERKEREKQKRKKAILAAAEKVFFAETGEGTMDEVAEMAELSKGTLYLYFRNKTDILYALAEKGVSLLTGSFDRIKDPKLTGKAQLSDLGDAFVRFVEEYPRHFELILRFEVTEPRYTTAGLLMEPALDVLRRIILKGQEDGTIRNDFSADEIVIILWSQMVGLMHTILRKDRYTLLYKADLKCIIKGHFRMVMKGIAPAS